MPAPFQAATLQFPIAMGEVETNLSRAMSLLREAAEAGASLCVLPEMWTTGFAYENLLRLSDSTPEILRELRRFAKGRRTVIAGSLPERSGRGVYNTLYLIDANGGIAGEYRKAHLFTPSGEHLHFRRGSHAAVARTSVGTIGPQICYDLRFPELSRKYFLQGATLLCVSAQWPSVRRGHWDLLIAARAVENQLFVVATNAVGRSGEFHYAGGSAILSPSGERLAEAKGSERIATATLDPAAVDEIRRRMPCAQDRNERAYRGTRRPG